MSGSFFYGDLQIRVPYCRSRHFPVQAIANRSGFLADGGAFIPWKTPQEHAALSWRPRRPVDHDGEWRGAALLQLACEEKTLAVRRHRIVGVGHLRLREIEQRLRQACLECVAALDVHRHQLPVSRK